MHEHHNLGAGHDLSTEGLKQHPFRFLIAFFTIYSTGCFNECCIFWIDDTATLVYKQYVWSALKVLWSFYFKHTTLYTRLDVLSESWSKSCSTHLIKKKHTHKDISKKSVINRCWCLFLLFFRQYVGNPIDCIHTQVSFLALLFKVWWSVTLMIVIHFTDNTLETP